MPDNFDGFLKITDVSSESKDPKHEGWIDVEAFTYSAKVSDYTIGQDGKLVADDARAGAFTFTQGMHKGSPTLFQFCVTRRQIPTVEFHARKASGSYNFIYFKAILTDCLITDVAVGAGSTPLPTETITIAYRKVQLVYREQDTHRGTGTGGDVTITFDAAANQ
ncbi:MAG TPA: type VI secretion system tube protein Hcp [Phycisphaerales bacterium]|nr:type VI secretion system tube protein Hcp [Phycisphaerales bacterium]